MRTRLALIVLTTVVFAFSCATAPAGTNVGALVPVQSAEKITEGVRLSYNRGFEQIAALLTEQGQDSQYMKLHQVRNFRQRWVRWAELQGNEYRALESGYTGCAWLVVVPPGHETLNRMVGTLQVESTSILTVLLMKPEIVTERWAGIFMVHELSHLMDRMYQVEPPNPTREQFLFGELRAYKVELLAASLLSKGGLERQIDLLLAKWQPSSHEEVIERVRNIDPIEWASLETSMGSAAPASKAEANLRGGFYVLVLSMRLASSRSDSEEAMLATLDSLYPKDQPTR